MSWEAFGSGAEPFDDFDAMVRRGWEFDADMTKARKDDEEWIPIEQAIEQYIEYLESLDE